MSTSAQRVRVLGLSAVLLATAALAATSLAIAQPIAHAGDSVGGKVTVRIAGTNDGGDRVTDGGVAGIGRFTASGAITEDAPDDSGVQDGSTEYRVIDEYGQPQPSGSFTPDANGEYRSFSRDGNTPRVEINNPLKAHTDLLPKYTDADIHNVTAYLVTLK